jgi:uncharacterized repeat protein (TIGR01451 family)
VFVPDGKITVAKITEGATGTAGFQITRTSGTEPVEFPRAAPVEFVQTATTHKQGVAADAVPFTSAGATDRLSLGTYRIVEAPPLVTRGSWTLTYVQCGGKAVPFEQGAVVVTLTAREPSVRCVFNDVFSPQPAVVPAPEPPAPLPPAPPGTVPPAPPGTVTPGPNPAQPSMPWADVAIARPVSGRTVPPGGTITYRIRVSNLGPDVAEDVIVDDKQSAGSTAVSATVLGGVAADQPGQAHSARARPRQGGLAGRCATGTVFWCDLGNLPPHAHVTILVRARVSAAISADAVIAHAVAGTSSEDPNLANDGKVGEATLTRPPPPVTG